MAIARPPLPTGNRALRKYIAGLSLERAVRLVRQARHFYTNTDEPLFDDDVFDNVLLARVAALDPEHPVLDEVGAEPVAGGGRPPKVKLPYVMPSLPKIKPDDGAAEWLARQTGRVTASDKIDGLSAQVIRDTELHMYTRGRGLVGQDITPRLRTTRGVGRLRVGQAVRGELVFLNATFAREFLNRTINNRVYKNPRNLMSGVVNTTRDHPAAPHAAFIVHAQLHPRARLAAAAPALRAAGWAVVPYRVFDRPTVDELAAYLDERKRAAKYEIDGLVLENERGEQIAFKMDAAPVLATVETVQWKLSQFGVYKPTVKLKTAMRLGGVDITNPTGHNARFVVKHGIGPGAVVKLVRAGDVIPKIVGTTTRAKPNFPPDAVWRDSKRIDIVPRTKTDSQARLQQVRRMETGLRVLGIEGVRETSMDKLYGAGLRTLPDLFNATLPQLLEAGTGAVFARKLREALDRVSRTATHPQMMQASGVWPSGFTTTRFRPINERVPFARLMAASRSRLIAVVARQPGWSVATATTFEAHLDDYAAWVRELPFVPRDAVAQAVIAGRLTGQTFVFTKIRDKPTQEAIVAEGGVVRTGSVSAQTTAVIAAGESDKTRRAATLGIPVLTLDEFRARFNIT